MEQNLYDFTLKSIAAVLAAIRFVYWRQTEIKADREKPRATSEKSIKRLFSIGIVFLIGIQFFGVQIFPFAHNVVVQTLGLVLFIIGFAVSMEGRRALGTNWSHAAEYQIKKNQELITTSVYQYIRHPIYAGLFLSAIGIELIFESYLVLIFMAVLLPYMYYQAKNEEKILTAHFGDSYKKYKGKTKMFFPFLK